MELKTKRALTVLSGWLEAANVPFSIKDSTISIKGTHSTVEVKIAEGEGCISAAKLTSSLDVSMPLFWALTERAGFGRPVVVSRGAGISEVSFEDTPELIAIRHREFRKVANPPPSVFKDPDTIKTVIWCSRKFYSTNKNLCISSGYEVEDISQFCWIYVTNFYGLWRHPEIDGNGWYDNKKGLYSYIRQRLHNDLRATLDRKGRSICIDSDTASEGQNVDFSQNYGNKQTDEGSYMERVAISRPADDSRDESHDDIVKSLKAKVAKKSIKAKRALDMHIGNCPICKA